MNLFSIVHKWLFLFDLDAFNFALYKTSHKASYQKCLTDVLAN